MAAQNQKTSLCSWLLGLALLEGKRCAQLAEARWFSPLGTDCLSHLSPGVGDGGQSDVDPRLCGLISVPSLPFQPGSSPGVNTSALGQLPLNSRELCV